MSLGNIFDSFASGFAYGVTAGFAPFGFYRPYLGFGCCPPCLNISVFAPNLSWFQPTYYPEISLYSNDNFSYYDQIQQTNFQTLNDSDSFFNKYIKPLNDLTMKARENASNGSYINPFSSFYSYYKMPQMQIPSPVNPFAKKESDEKSTDSEKQAEVTNQQRDEKQETAAITYDAKKLKANWSKKQPQLTNQFYNRVVEISKKVRCNPEDLMAVMNLETRRTFSPSERNSKSSTQATGLIQFTKTTAPDFGTTVDMLAKMTAVEQLDYVEKYLIRKKKDAKFKDSDVLGPGDLYALVFQPAKAKNEVLAKSGTREYNENRFLDENKDHKITKTDLAKSLDKFRV